MSKGKDSWCKTRHKVLTFLLGPIVWILCRVKYGARIERFREQGNRPYLILYNHQTPYDQFFVNLSFRGPVYCMATEDIFSLGWVSKLLSWAFAPIPIRKQVADLSAIRSTLKCAKDGGTIAIAAEGNRTYSGKTEHISSGMVKLIRMVKYPLAFYRIEGGYGVEPRWSDKTRRGKMRTFVSRVVEYEDIKAMSDQELYDLVTNELYVNEAKVDGLYKSNRRAEYLERAIYICPECGLAKHRSSGNEMECLSCHRKIRYMEDKTLEGIGYDFPFKFVNDWYEYQKAFVNNLNPKEYIDESMFVDEGVGLCEEIPFDRKVPIYQAAEVKLFGDRIEIRSGEDEMIIPFSQVEGSAVMGRNKMTLNHGGKTYQFKGDKSFNGLKYVNIFYRYKNLAEGEVNGEFLGL